MRNHSRKGLPKANRRRCNLAQRFAQAGEVGRVEGVSDFLQRWGNGGCEPGGKLLVLEFSKVAKPLEKPYDWYSFNILPKLGNLVAGDDASYRYLAESIRMHPSQEELKQLMKQCGFGHVDFHNLSAGVVALHVGIKC